MINFLTRKTSGQKEQFKGKYYLLFALGYSFFAICLLDSIFVIKHAQAAFTSDVPYQQAVPDFLEAITEATTSVKDEGELEEIAEWAEETRARLPEFLEDLIEIARQLEENGNEEFIIEEYQAFADKWNSISQSYPGLSELEPVLGPIIDQLLSGLPKLKSNTSENPVGNLFELYVEMEQHNPWFVGLLWNIPVMENTQKRSEIVEKIREITIEGYKAIEILERDIVVKVNGSIAFSESIRNGVLVGASLLLRDPSVLHETLEKMIEDGGARREIAIVREFIELIDLNLQSALQNGIIDDCSYSFIFRKQFHGVKDTCIDIIGNERNFNEILKYSPFDHVNQVELTYVHPLAKLTIPGANTFSPAFINPQIEPPAIGSTSEPIHPPLELWLFGILTPTYLWSVAGFIRLF